MSWQDIAITACNILFSYALIPQILLNFKKKKSLIAKQTAALTALGMATMATTFLTLNLTFSTVIGYISATLWTILLIQSIVYKNQ